MAKSESFFDKRRGSVGGLTFRVRNGKQITSEKASFVKNPKTRYQAEQRMVMSAASKFGTAFKKVIDNSFEGVAIGEDSVNHFQSLAMQGQGFVFGVKKGSYGFMPEEYVMSEGTLGSNNATCATGKGTLLVSAPTTNTMAAFLLKNTKYRSGDQLTIAAVIAREGTPNDDDYLNPMNMEVVTDYVILNSQVQDVSNFTTVDGWFTLDLKTSDNGSITYNPGDKIVAIAIITSRKDDDESKWKRSTESMYIDETLTPQAEDINADCVLTFMKAARKMRSDAYLNHAE